MKVDIIRSLCVNLGLRWVALGEVNTVRTQHVHTRVIHNITSNCVTTYIQRAATTLLSFILNTKINLSFNMIYIEVICIVIYD